MSVCCLSLSCASAALCLPSSPRSLAVRLTERPSPSHQPADRSLSLSLSLTHNLHAFSPYAIRLCFRFSPSCFSSCHLIFVHFCALFALSPFASRKVFVLFGRSSPPPFFVSFLRRRFSFVRRSIVPLFSALRALRGFSSNKSSPQIGRREKKGNFSRFLSAHFALQTRSYSAPSLSQHKHILDAIVDDPQRSPGLTSLTKNTNINKQQQQRAAHCRSWRHSLSDDDRLEVDRAPPTCSQQFYHFCVIKVHLNLTSTRKKTVTKLQEIKKEPPSTSL